MSIAAQCSDCCTCPEPEFLFYPIPASDCAARQSTNGASQCGITPYDDGSYDPGSPSDWGFYGKKYATLTHSGAVGFYIERTGGSGAGIDTVRKDCYGGTLVFTGCSSSQAFTTATFTEQGAAPVTAWPSVSCTPSNPDSSDIFFPPAFWTPSYVTDGITLTSPAPPPVSDPNATTTYYSTVEYALSDEVTADDAIALETHTTDSGCCAFTSDDSTFTGPLSTAPNYLGPGSRSVRYTVSLKGQPDTTYLITVMFDNYDPDGVRIDDTFGTVEVTTDENGEAEFTGDVPQPEPGYTRCFAGVVSEFYTFRFKIPQVGTGKNYRLTWVERVFPEAGAGVSSVEVYSQGVYRPTVTISAPPSGGTQARAVAVMDSSGGVASILVLNPGSGYLVEPTVTVQTAINGGTTSTGWTATLANGRVSAISGGSAGDYLPTLAFPGSATATATMDAQGGIESVSVSGGSGYTLEPSLTITPKVSGATDADLLVHIGTETAKSWQWDSEDVPPDYDPEDELTWPLAGDDGNPYFVRPSMSTSIANIRATCLPAA